MFRYLASFCFLWLFTAAAQTEVTLWPNGAPGSEGKTDKEIVEQPNAQHNYLKAWNIHKPSVAVFLPSKEKASGAAIVVVPGGGHRALNMDAEGYNVAKYLNSIGVAAFVLKYRLARETGSTYKIEEHALADAQRAIRVVRSRAAEWQVDPKRVGIMGFSAGGELAALAGSRSEGNKPAQPDAIDALSARPDFQALIYPGGIAKTAVIDKDTPPAFLLSANNDRSPSETIGELYLAFKKAGVPVEIHVYTNGGHGFGLREETRAHPIANSWYIRLTEWLKDTGMLGK